MKIQPINFSQNTTNVKNSVSFNADLHVTDSAKKVIFNEIDRLYGGGSYYTESEV